MPYNNQTAGKGGHTDIIKNPDVQSFLDNCDPITAPNEEEAKKIVADFIKLESSSTWMPLHVVASDASPYSEPVNGLFPSTQIGYVKNSLVIIDVSSYDGLRPVHSNFVDPFRIAQLHRNGDPISFTLPGSNIRYKGAKTVQDGFRRAVYEQLSDIRTSFTNDKTYNVVGTLLAIDDKEVELETCPSCKESQSFIFKPNEEVQVCSYCGEDIFVTDTLRIHEQISDHGENGSAMTRFMNVVEHLIIASFIRMLGKHNPELLSRMAFIIDGPLAIFGQPAKTHARLMKLYDKVSEYMRQKNLDAPLIIGIQKSGAAVEHAKALGRYIPNGTFRVIDDEYRYTHISARAEKSSNFGNETYYGQDFIYKTESGKVFVFGLPYPFANKKDVSNFASEKIKLEHYYSTIGKAMKVISHFELELYDDAIVPIALAHRHASISLVPGGKVLEILTRKGLNI
ncbi:DNA double-strand break repair nuclease NurA [Vibrio cholerae]|uniref:hypothetical protein n=1 Tax=Vibrio cholerae TaxID=666 RepID=UPI002088C18C|nr:hypothetical protein [Vibrio cholerae]EIN5961805.1 DNA double-strand break repair nuclease NurA [Vibrio cholerae]EJI4017040.1 DNA double-strand break repair nuclease NurA [Vibrio cholerae]EJL6274544.1 DNA double-strand break repair nuclease NurA [Vibrio cholerae]ELJ8571525.1 DNA double-strand break repair nuclease NurA [Vibrio cholerae]MCR9683639.1 hypothetical protein [Vibrio cholerae]